MMIFAKNGLILLILKLVLNSCNGDRIKDRMYIDVKASTSCFRRFNATHQVGCSSQRGGANGVIHFCTKESDLHFILKNGTAGPYVPIVPASLLTEKSVKLLKLSPKVSGLVVYPNNETLNSFTHDLKCPNENFAVPNTCGKNEITWNPRGTGLLFQDIGFPVFFIDLYEDVTSVKECFQKFNNFSYDTQRDRALCSIQLNSFMYGAKNTPTCIRRSNIATNLNPMRVCDPLGSKNVWASLFPLATYNNETEEVKPILGQKYIVVASRSDAASLFDRTVGAESPITGLVTLLAVAKILKQLLPQNKNYTTNVLFILFNGESFDYLGSQRIVYDMERGNFPVETENGTSVFLPVIKAKDITLFIELSQLSRGDGHVFIHRYKLDRWNTRFTDLLKINSHSSLTLATSDGTLPPSSVHTFIRKYQNLSTLVLANHEREYSNRFYNSIFDNSTNINFRYFNRSDELVPIDSIQYHLVAIANTISKSIYQEVTGVRYEDGDVDLFELVNELLYCFLEDQNCKLHQVVGKIPQKQQDQPLNLYVGVDGNTNDAVTLIGFILGWLTGDIVGESNQNCTNISKNYAFRFYNMSVDMAHLNVTKCFRMVMNFTDAVSPAFIIEGYDWSSNLYSSWSESTWGDMNARLFLKPSAAQESMVMAVGSISIIFSFLIVYFIKSRSDILFCPTATQPSPVDC
ncbi:hypothetical protein HHI36_021200 [Cryptolaemus montrouzieri]|uniref:Nicastrin n=1 Tax=Cryptolaemus montrouzieri TaxID=559131 RepID=A0ABD2MX35_9CUCU